MKIIELEQRTPAWDEFRLNKISATMAAPILDLCPYKSRYDLWKEATGLKERDPMNSFMQRGIELEDVARKKIEEQTGIVFPPFVVQHDDYDWMIASLDGLNQEKKIVLEIKCPGKTSMEVARSGKIPANYYAQMQHQMAVTGYSICYYYVFDGENGTKMEVERCDYFIENMIKEEKKFYESMVNMEYI